MKRLTALILSAAIIASLFCACGTAEDSKTHTVYFRDYTKSQTASATFFNSKSGKKKEVKMKPVEKDKNSTTFSCEGDTSLYNMAYITCGKEKTGEFAFNKCVSGWQKTEDNFLPYTYGEKETNYFAKFDKKTLKYKGYEKDIYIWKPDDYDAKSSEKYATVYVLDAQFMTTAKEEKDTVGGCPVVPEQVKAMTQATGKKAIMVGVDNSFPRDYELVPKIGVSADEKRFGKAEYFGMNGTEFSDFAAKVLVPYIQKNYNVETNAENTSLAGASLSGLSAFYITTEHPELFGTLGAFSPSFWEFDDTTWEKYLKKKSFDENSPFLYFYTGAARADTDPYVTNMYNRLKKLGYPKEKLALHFNEKGEHSAVLWRSVFSEFLNAMVFQRLEPLQNDEKK